MNEWGQFVSASYMGTVVYGGATLVGSGSSNCATGTVISGSGMTNASLIATPGGCGQWVQVILTRALSQWQIQGIKRLRKVLSLPENWDSYGSCPPTEEAANTATDILTKIDIDYFVAPRVVPVSGGGLQLEWEIGTRALELEILDDGSVEYLTTERREPHQEGPLHAVADVRPIFLWLLSEAVQLAA
jgi:hypothetical protein